MGTDCPCFFYMYYIYIWRWSCADLGELEFVIERPEDGSSYASWEEDMNELQDDTSGTNNEKVTINQPVGLNGQNIDLDLDLGPFIGTLVTLVALFAIGFASYNWMSLM